jgi:predicted regulator of Ras-like GTPase activity (Roadblock/LC7/MglB family)
MAHLATRLLRSDNRIVRVLVIGKTGELLAVKDGKPIPRGSRPPPAELTRRASAFAVAYGAAEGATKYLGDMQYTVLAYEDYKVMLVVVPSEEVLVSIRLPRDVHAEEIYQKVIRHWRPSPA